MNNRPAQHLKDDNLFTVVSYLQCTQNLAILCIGPLCKLECFILLMSWSQFPVNTVCSFNWRIPRYVSERVLLPVYVESIWIESTYRVHITKFNPPPRVETTSTWCYVIQCKICYTSGTNAFYLLYTPVNKSWVASIFFECVFGGHFEFQNGAIFSLVLTSISSESTQNHISLMIFITYVCKNVLQI